MADPAQDLPSWLFEVGGTIAAAILSGIGSAKLWFSSAKKKLETKQLELTMAQELLDRRVRELEIINRSTADSLERMDRALQDINKKQDRQTMILIDIASNRTPGRDHDQ